MGCHTRLRHEREWAQLFDGVDRLIRPKCERAFADVCRRNGIHRSMGRVGPRYHNALAESFFQDFKRELLHGRRCDVGEAGFGVVDVAGQPVTALVPAATQPNSPGPYR
ncbi:transposase InsO family protein [Streptomyces sp. SAI-135]|nr:transposase InsO family protein [Streptomyces sp. SAI-090]MDH6554904.1 transposase InsO family protein [Streptomyces sp. SAI-041]MDH6574172.1 transposase InsO family protein [Streptomyces sp. SAI-117]MDH6581091.1 transposase InsO family protein [Streptomyces sp. SAI-133]MDH6613098.1 transposase InsO family protein [Streptomyces sp. SAI-135]